MTSSPDEPRPPNDIRDTLIPFMKRNVTSHVRIATVTRKQEWVEVERVTIGNPILDDVAHK